MKQPNCKNQRILVVDDNPAIHDDFRKIFRADQDADLIDAAEAALFGEELTVSAQERFTIEFASQGQEALTMVEAALKREEPYAMAFVDVRMPPGWDGIETVARIWEVYPDLQVVICTAYSDYSWEEMSKKLGNSDRLVILKKPFDTIEAIQFAHALTAKWHLLQQVKGRIDVLEAAAMNREIQLRNSEARFRLIAENASDLITVRDVDGGRLYSSPSHSKVLGIPSVDSGCSFAEEIHPDDEALVRRAMEESCTSGKPYAFQYRSQHRDGSWKVLESHINPVSNAAGVVETLVLVSRDITERVKTEDERRQMEVQLRHAQKMESIGQLAAGIAHEINTPTQYIGDNTQFLRDSFTDLVVLIEAHSRLLACVKSGSVQDSLLAEVESASSLADIEYLSVEIPKAIEQSLQGVHSVSRIVGAMKEFSHPGTQEKTSVDLNRAIESTLTVATNEWKYVADLVTDLDPGLPPVVCLPGEFNQVILNIVVNACHAIADVVGDGSQGKGTIRVGTRLDGDYVEIRIGDTGTGMPEHVRQKIFDPFFTTKGVGRGTGQGLAITHSVIVDKHGGTIEVDTTPGRGTTFILRLPITPDRLERRAA